MFLICSILMLLIIAFQVYSLSKYDYFKAEGGVKVDFKFEYEDITKSYARASLDFDYVMKDAVRTHTKNGGDFLTVLAESNQKVLGKPFVQLFNYREIEELSIKSSDDEVIDFLRSKTEVSLKEAAVFYGEWIRLAVKSQVDVDYDTEELTMKIELPGYSGNLKREDFVLPKLQVSFYEVFRFQEFSQEWNEICALYEPDTISKDTDEEWKLTDVNKEKTPIQSLKNSVQWQHGGEGVVYDKDKQFVENIIYSEKFKSAFDEKYRVSWSQHKTQYGRQEAYWFLYFLRIPKNEVSVITDKDIASAKLVKNTHGEGVSIEMSVEGAGKLRTITEDNLGRLMAICTNGFVLSAPNVHTPIYDGVMQINGSSKNNFRELVKSLNRKTLNALPIIVKRTTVKPHPPVFTSFIQQLLLAASVIIFLFFSILFTRNFWAN